MVKEFDLEVKIASAVKVKWETEPTLETVVSESAPVVVNWQRRIDRLVISVLVSLEAEATLEMVLPLVEVLPILVLLALENPRTRASVGEAGTMSAGDLVAWALEALELDTERVSANYLVP